MLDIVQVAHQCEPKLIASKSKHERKVLAFGNIWNKLKWTTTTHRIENSKASARVFLSCPAETKTNQVFVEFKI